MFASNESINIVLRVFFCEFHIDYIMKMPICFLVLKLQCTNNYFEPVYMPVYTLSQFIVYAQSALTYLVISKSLGYLTFVWHSTLMIPATVKFSLQSQATFQFDNFFLQR